MTVARPTSSAAALVTELDAVDDHLDLRMGRPSGSGWLAASELPAEGGGLLDRLLGAIAEQADGHRDTAAASLMGWYGRPITSIAVAGWFLHRRVLDIAPDVVHLHVHHDGWFDAVSLDDPGMAVLPGDPAAGEPGVLVAVDQAALQAHLLASLLRHLSPVIAAIRARSPIGLRALWGTVADDIAFGFVTAGRHVGEIERARVEGDAVLVAAAPPLQAMPSWFPFEHRGQPQLHVTRGTCCLAHKAPGNGYCTTCPSTSDEERCQRLCRWLDTRATGA